MGLAINEGNRIQARTEPTDSALSTVPFATVIGAEVLGLQISTAGRADIEFVKQALDKHSVVLLRNQEFTPSEQIAFVRGLGELHALFYSRYAVPGHPELTVVSNITKDGEAIGIADAGMLWHTDGSFNARPDMYSLLYGIEIPHRDGQAIGDTAFASTVHAFKTLPQELQTRLTTLTSTHSFIHHLDKKQKKGQLKRAPLTPEQKAKLPDVSHPVVRRHPNTGEPCLYVSEGHTRCIDGMASEESDALLEQLWEHVRDPRFQYRHQWRKGDVVIWDNCAVQHLAIFDYGEIPRRMHRAGTLGGAPVAWRNA